MITYGLFQIFKDEMNKNLKGEIKGEKAQS